MFSSSSITVLLCCINNTTWWLSHILYHNFYHPQDDKNLLTIINCSCYKTTPRINSIYNWIKTITYEILLLKAEHWFHQRLRNWCSVYLTSRRKIQHLCRLISNYRDNLFLMTLLRQLTVCNPENTFKLFNNNLYTFLLSQSWNLAKKIMNETEFQTKLTKLLY